MKKDINYYMNLNYPIKLVRLSNDDGGGYMATIPLLGEYAFVGDGESSEEALNNLERVKADWFKTLLENGNTIPEPILEEDIDYSGKFVVRIPKSLHRRLATQAKLNETSLNQYVQYLLSSTTAVVGMETAMQQCITHFTGKLNEAIQHTTYIIECEIKKESEKASGTNFPKNDYSYVMAA
jgi:antitoxin HicB